MDGTLERIIELMKKEGIQEQEMIESLGLTRGTFFNWKQRNGKSYYEHIDKIADQLGVSIDYLIRGYEMDSKKLTKKEEMMLDTYRNLSEEKKKLVEDGIRLLSS